jgi:hypothetical protein
MVLFWRLRVDSDRSFLLVDFSPCLREGLERRNVPNWVNNPHNVALGCIRKLAAPDYVSSFLL